MKKLVTTQPELDQAIADGITDLIIDAPRGAYLEIRHDGLLRLWGSSRAVLRGSSRAVLRESSRAVLWGSSSAVLWGSSSAVLWGSSSAVLRGSSSAELRESSSAELRESSSAELRGSSRAVLRGSSRAELRESSRAELRESSSAVLRESSSAELWESSSAELWESSSAELRESSRAVLRESSRAVLRGSSRAELRESSRAELGRWTVVHVWSQQVTVSGDGHVIDMTAVDLADVDTWRAYTGADRPADASRDHLIVGHVSSQDHPGRLDRDGKITIGCFRGDVAKLRKLVTGDQWPSDAGSQSRVKYRPRILAFADLCDEQMAAWAEAQK